MTRLSPQARAIVDAGRGGAEPTAEDRARVGRALAAKIGIGIATATATTTVGTAAAGAAKLTLGTFMGTSLGKGVLVVLAVAAVGITYRVVSPSAQRPNVAVTASSSPREAPISSSVVQFSQPQNLPTAPLAPFAEPATPPVVAPASARETAALSATARPSDRLEQEVARLRRVHEALQEGRPDNAMAELDGGAQGEQDEVLAEERAALQVFALCEMGKVAQARAQADRFLARWPQSPQAPRVRARCASPDGGNLP